jgi:1-acyl-sn-glycerol-3-phosphate acyltransferase
MQNPASSIGRAGGGTLATPTSARYSCGVRLLALFQYLFGVVATLALAPWVWLFSIVGWQRAAFVPIRIWATLLHMSTGIRLRSHGLGNVPDSPYVVISNHCSHLDGPSIVRALPDPVYFVIKRELARIPLWGPTTVRAGFIAVDRSDSEQAQAQMAEAVDAIRKGRRVLVFAEGTRSKDGRLQPFKKGGFHLAIDAQVPILPVAVNGSYRLLPKGQPAARPGILEVMVGEPIATSGLDKEDVGRLMEQTRRTILEARRNDPDFVE